MNLAELSKVAEAMVAPGRGILAADESSGTIKKRFDAIGVENTEDNRRDYRELMFRTGEAMSKHISGVILYDETIRQKAKDGTQLVKLIEQAGALPGIKVDKGTKALPFCPGEVITEGLDGLRERLAEYRNLGARFAKWRAVIDIGAGIPSYTAIKVESTEDSRRDYREMLFRSSEAMSKYISGVILYDETIWQNARDGTPLVKLIEQAGAIPGIKVDEGTQALPNCPGELVTAGLDKLAERLKKYHERGQSFLRKGRMM